MSIICYYVHVFKQWISPKIILTIWPFLMSSSFETILLNQIFDRKISGISGNKHNTKNGYFILNEI